MAVVRLDKIAGIHLESIQAPVELTNGLFLQLGGLVDGETELRTVTVPTDVENGDIVFHATPEVDPDPRKAGLKHFRVAQGERGRGYRLIKGDILTLTADLFDSAPKVGDVALPQNESMKLDVYVKDVSDEAKLRFKVIEETTLGFDADQAFAIQVIAD